MTEIVVRHGFAAVTVSDVLDAAGASRATFYQHFRDVEDCFLHVYRWHATRLLGKLEAAAAGSRRPELAILEALAREAQAMPEPARLLMVEGLGSGPRGLAQRESLVADMIRLLDGRRVLTDLPQAALIGGALRYLGRQLSVGETSEDAPGHLHTWAAAFARRSPARNWSLVLTQPRPAKGAVSSSQPGHVSPFAPQRERIILATAALVRSVGYRATTIADIVTGARVSRRTFYNHFPDKPAAFTAAYEHGFQQALAACTPAFFNSGTWAERVWQSGVAFTGFFAREPLLAYLGLSQCNSLGPRFAGRVLETQLAFTWFLEEGYQQPAAHRSATSRTYSELISAAIYELGHRVVHRGSALRLRAMLPAAAYISLAPFIGVDEAAAFALDKVSTRRNGSR